MTAQAFSATIFDPDALTAEITELEAAMGAPGFWDDQDLAARTSSQHSRATARLEGYKTLTAEIDVSSSSRSHRARWIQCDPRSPM